MLMPSASSDEVIWHGLASGSCKPSGPGDCTPRTPLRCVAARFAGQCERRAGASHRPLAGVQRPDGA